MRDYGKVFSTFWTSDSTRGMSDDAKVLALYLLTGPHSNIIGCFRLPDGYVSEDEGIKQRSAMNPFLWILGIIIMPCLAGEYIFQHNETVMYSLLCAAGITLLCVLGVAMYFVFNAPDKLRSEEYQLLHDWLKYCEQTQTSPELAISALTINTAAIESGE